MNMEHFAKHAEEEVECQSTTRKNTRFFADFLKGPNCETMCKRTKLREQFADEIHKVTYTVATQFGELITADHKVFKEEGESRKNHRYVNVVQDLAFHRILG